MADSKVSFGREHPPGGYLTLAVSAVASSFLEVYADLGNPMQGVRAIRPKE